MKVMTMGVCKAYFSFFHNFVFFSFHNIRAFSSPSHHLAPPLRLQLSPHLYLASLPFAPFTASWNSYLQFLFTLLSFVSIMGRHSGILVSTFLCLLFSSHFSSISTSSFNQLAVSLDPQSIISISLISSPSQYNFILFVLHSFHIIRGIF